MGMWGYKLYQNDTALDVKDLFQDLYRTGKSVQEITDQMTQDSKSMFGDPTEEAFFWFALADSQWEYGVLLPSVQKKALDWIDQRLESPSAWQEMLVQLRVRLLSPQPPVKKISLRRIYRCQWKLGDVFALPLESDLAREKGLFGQYFLIQKVDEGVWYPGHIVPIVYVRITQNGKLPSTTEELNALEYVQTDFTRYENRFWPVDMTRPQEDIAEKSKINYEVDDYGFLPQYRILLLNTSAKVIPKNLIYIGNFPNAKRPPKEFIPHAKTNLLAVAWKRFDETFETKMIKQFCNHNRRELAVYKGTPVS